MVKKKLKHKPIVNSIKEWIAYRGFNIAEVAKSVGLTRQHLSSIIKGNVMPQPPTLLNLAMVLNVPMEQLVWFDIDDILPEIYGYFENFSAIKFQHQETGKVLTYREMVEIVKEFPSKVVEYTAVFEKKKKNSTATLPRRE